MTVLAEVWTSPVEEPGRIRRIWDAPPWKHTVVLALLLVILVPVVGTGASFLSDEGAAIIQGRSLSSGQGWIVPHPMPEIDADGRFYPLVNSERGTRGFAPLAKHPAYAVLVAGADLLGGVAAMVLLSIAGVVASAGLAGALAGRLDQVLARPAIWAVGVASPLFFDGFLVMGHTLGAALAAGAVLCAVVAISARRPVVALAVAPCIGGAVLLRSEAVLFAGALAVVAVTIALRGRARTPALLVAGASVVASVTARLAETAWLAAVVGSAPPAVKMPVPVGGEGFLEGRIDSLFITWLLPDYRSTQPFTLLMLGMVTALAVTALASRSSPLHRVRVLVPAGLAALAALAAFLAAPATVVPGLLVAFPLMTAGLLVLRRPLLREEGAALVLGTFLLFAVAVIMTQYRSGGTGEWGGRYFALGIPIVVPVLLLALHRQGRMLDRITRRGVAAALVVCSVTLATMALSSVRSSHQHWSRFQTAIRQAQDVAGPGRPVITTWSAAPRFAWSVFDRSPWLLARPADLEGLRGSLAGLGVDRFVYVTVDLEADRSRLAGLDVVWTGGPHDGGRRIVVLAESGRLN